MTMYDFKNTKLDDLSINSNTVFVGAFGYEKRSTYIYEEYFTTCVNKNKIIFVIEDKQISKEAKHLLSELDNIEINIIRVKYGDYVLVISAILDFLRDLKNGTDKPIEINVDYSSMPRTWYCRLPIEISQQLNGNDEVIFWYAEGNYPRIFKKYPTAGIANYDFFSGRPSLTSDGKETHIFGLGYDSIRTNAILSVIDPSRLVTCYSYETQNMNRLKEVKKRNNNILIRSSLSMGLPMENFEFTISKLCELTYELFYEGDVILVPDGPKPLILAMSIVPIIINKEGIVSLHINRNLGTFSKVEVIPNGNIHGFKIKNKDL